MIRCLILIRNKNIKLKKKNPVFPNFLQIIFLKNQILTSLNNWLDFYFNLQNRAVFLIVRIHCETQKIRNFL